MRSREFEGDSFKALSKVLYKGADFSLFMRPLEEADARIIHEAVILSVTNLYPFMDWSHKALSIESQLERIRKARDAYVSRVEFDFAVFDQKTDEFMMSASLSKARSPNEKSLGMGYWTSAKYCNRGLATIVAKILSVIAFDYIDCDRLEIGCNKANKKSIGVIERCEFKFEGEARNYFSKPTDDMIRNGYNTERTCLLYALTAQDVPDLSWYEQILTKLTFSQKD